ncbi:MAG: XisI protein [Planctomycetes bacterium]|jgi:hypothetical protein|nr:XisI protein [Planctomycetota bacterium]
MDPLNSTRDLVEKVLRSHVYPDRLEKIETQTVFDRTNDHYLILHVGWGKQRRIHGVLAHIDLVGDKLWIQTDGTEVGLANELVEAGISPQQIVLGFRIPEIRKHTGFAVG